MAEEYPLYVSKFLKWLRQNPNATQLAAQLYNASGLDYFHNSINQAKKAAGINGDHMRKKGGGRVRSKSELKQMKKEFDHWLKMHPTTLSKDLAKDHKVIIKEYYENSLTYAKVRNGLRGYIGGLSSRGKTSRYLK